MVASGKLGGPGVQMQKLGTCSRRMGAGAHRRRCPPSWMRRPRLEPYRRPGTSGCARPARSAERAFRTLLPSTAPGVRPCLQPDSTSVAAVGRHPMHHVVTY